VIATRAKVVKLEKSPPIPPVRTDMIATKRLCEKIEVACVKCGFDTTAVWKCMLAMGYTAVTKRPRTNPNAPERKKAYMKCLSEVFNSPRKNLICSGAFC
jgi:hypothetical protein